MTDQPNFCYVWLSRVVVELGLWQNLHCGLRYWQKTIKYKNFVGLDGLLDAGVCMQWCGSLNLISQPKVSNTIRVKLKLEFKSELEFNHFSCWWMDGCRKTNKIIAILNLMKMNLEFSLVIFFGSMNVRDAKKDPYLVTAIIFRVNPPFQ